MDCVEEAEDPREKPHQTGNRTPASVEVVGERAGRMVERRCLAYAIRVRQPVLPENGVIQLTYAGLTRLLCSKTAGCRTARPSPHWGCAVWEGESVRALSTRLSSGFLFRTQLLNSFAVDTVVAHRHFVDHDN